MFALCAVDLEIKGPVNFALLGPNGSGKSTMIKCLLGLVIPDSGTIAVDGVEYPSGMPGALARTGYMPQSPDFPENLRVEELIDLFNSLSADPPVHRDELLKDLGINGFLKKRFHDLSRGMKQKINLLQCFMSERELYILDEPTASLDPLNAYYLKNRISDCRKRGAAVLFTSHIMKEVEELSEELCLMLEGKIITRGKPDAIIKKSGSANLEEALVREWKASGYE